MMIPHTHVETVGPVDLEVKNEGLLWLRCDDNSFDLDQGDLQRLMPYFTRFINTGSPFLTPVERARVKCLEADMDKFQRAVDRDTKNIARCKSLIQAIHNSSDEDDESPEDES